MPEYYNLLPALQKKDGYDLIARNGRLLVTKDNVDVEEITGLKPTPANIQKIRKAVKKVVEDNQKDPSPTVERIYMKRDDGSERVSH